MTKSPETAHISQPHLKRFGGFEFDLLTGELSRDGIETHLQGQPLQLLELLLQRPNQLVTREQIQQLLWADGTVVEFEHSVNAAVKRLRAVLGDDPDKPTFIETIPRRGYRFIAQVENGPKSEPVPQVTAAAYPSQPRRQRRVWLASGAAAFLIVAVVVATWRFSSARPALTGTDVILLATFVNKTGDPIFDNSLDKALEVKLTESPFLSVFPESDARATLRTMRHDTNEPITKELAVEICKRQGLRAAVVPEIASFGSIYLITLEAVDAQNQRVIAQQQVEAAGKEKVVAALGKAAARLRRQLGESRHSLETYNAPLDLATTSSLEALQAYRSGQTLYRSGKRREAIPFFERAVELDPQFCSGYAMLGSAYHSVGDEQGSRKNFASAFELKDRRLTQEENFQTTALYHSAITENLEKVIAVLTLYKQSYPRSAFAHNLLGIALARLGKPEEALQEFHWAIEDSPVPSAQHYYNASHSLMILGRYDEAKKLLDRWQQKGSNTPFQIAIRYRIAFIENDAATMEQLAQETPADDAHWLRLQEEYAFLRGDFRKLRSLSDSLVKQQTTAKRGQNAAFELAWHGWMESYVANYELARTLCRQSEEASPDDPLAIRLCAYAWAEAGEVTRAEEKVASLDRLSPDDTENQKRDLPLIRSIIERKRGRPTQALDLLASVSPFEQDCWQALYHRAQAYLASGDHANAAAEFERLMSHRGWDEWELFAPLAQLGLARAYAMQGEQEKSRKAYEDFFATWKDADPDIGILRQAKAEYTKLTTPAPAAVSPSGTQR
ncbi:MAG TPA: tetratricopeptide repeat protein [Terriglobales bacterium]|nr:tetratricopeptide repeat protein [Terriglobales bacterium]